MKVLLDENVPVQLGLLLDHHQVLCVDAMAWNGLLNGALLKTAEEAFQVMITADQGIFYQQNNEHRKLSLVVLNTNYRPSVEQSARVIAAAVARASPGSFEEVYVGPSRAPRIQAVK